MSVNPPKPYRLSGADFGLFDIYTPGSGDGPGGFKYDKPVLGFSDIPGNLVAMSSSRSFRLGVNAADKNFDLYLPTHSPSGTELVPLLGWRYEDSDANRYAPMGEAIPTNDGRQRVPVRLVRS